MCRVSHLRLDCGLDEGHPHYRRPDELEVLVQEIGAHIKPCVERIVSHGDCGELTIDNRLNQGSLPGITCSYCAVAQPCWTQALDDFLEGAKQDLQRYWHDNCDAFRNPDSKCFDRPDLVEKYARDTCLAAGIAVRTCVENRDGFLMDSTRVPSTPRLGAVSPVTTATEEIPEVCLATVEQQIAERLAEIVPQKAASDEADGKLGYTNAPVSPPISKHVSFSASPEIRPPTPHPESCTNTRRATSPTKSGVQKRTSRKRLIRMPSHEKLHRLVSQVDHAGLKSWREKKRDISRQGFRPASKVGQT